MGVAVAEVGLTSCARGPGSGTTSESAVSCLLCNQGLKARGTPAVWSLGSFIRRAWLQISCMLHLACTVVQVYFKSCSDCQVMPRSGLYSHAPPSS
jgi:hypothetical protein